VRITVGKKITDGKVEVFTRNDKVNRDVALDRAVDEALALLDSYPLRPLGN